jgi:hypothetical protein
MKNNKLFLDLVVIIGEDYLKSPIDYTVYSNQQINIDSLLKNKEILKLPNDMNCESQKKFYHIEKDSFLDEGKTYCEEKVKTGDTLVLTDINDKDILKMMGEDFILKDKYKNRNQKNSRWKVVVKGILQGIPWIGPALCTIIFGED